MPIKDLGTLTKGGKHDYANAFCGTVYFDFLYRNGYNNRFFSARLDNHSRLSGRLHRCDVFDRFEDTALVLELLNGMYAELPEKKAAKER